MNLLSILIWFPIGMGILFLSQRIFFPKTIAVSTSLVCLSLACYLYGQFDLADSGMQFQETIAWIPILNIFYRLGVDGFSLALLLLTCFMGTMSLLVSLRVSEKPMVYWGHFLILQGLLCGVFAALDAILFYVFWEAILIPMFLIIGIWGGHQRIYATVKFFLYTFLGSVFLLICLLYLYSKTGSWEILAYYGLPLEFASESWLFWGMVVAFGIKIPMFPVHTWLPHAHVQAPTAGSVMLAAILLKLGGYGFLRFILPITPQASVYFSEILIVLSLIAIVYIGFVALAQTDLKKLVAYSSIAHMGFVILGLFSGVFVCKQLGRLEPAEFGLEGAMIQMISHGLISGALFICVGILFDRTKTKTLKAFSGLATSMPLFSCCLMLFTLGNIGLPGTSGFVGELFVIVSSFQVRPVYGILAACTVVLSAAYMLGMAKQVVYGKPIETQRALLSRLTLSEKITLFSLSGLVLFLGLWPAPIQQLVFKANTQLLQVFQKEPVGGF